MKKRFLQIGFLLSLGAIVAIGCNKKDDDNNNGSGNGLDRKPMLENYATNYVVPAYADMVQQLSSLKASVETFNTTPNPTNLTAVRESWKTAYITWQKVDLLEFGPAEEATLRTFVNVYPVSTTKVDGNISTGTYNLEEFGSKDAQGFPAMDYLLNGIASTDQVIIDLYTTDANAANRKQYLADVVNKVIEKVSGVNDKWASYSGTFMNNTGTDVNSSLSTMVNAYVLYYERYFRSGKVGLPVGAMTGFASPQVTEAYYYPSISKELALTALNSVKDFYKGNGYNGTQGASMQSYLASIGTKDDNGVLISDLIETEMNQAITALQGLNTTIIDGVQNNRTQVLTIYEEIQDVVPLLKVDMVSAFSISITYTDNDGD